MGYIFVQNRIYPDFRAVLLSGEANSIAANIAKLPELLEPHS